MFIVTVIRYVMEEVFEDVLYRRLKSLSNLSVRNGMPAMFAKRWIGKIDLSIKETIAYNASAAQT